MPLTLIRHHDPVTYRDAAQDFLLAGLAANNQLFTIVQNMTSDAMQRRQGWLTCLERDGRVCGMALIYSAPPLRSLIISEIDADGAALVAAALHRSGIVPTDVSGPPDSVGALFSAFDPLASSRLRARLGNQLLETPPTMIDCAGEPRAAGLRDAGLLIEWERAFQIECGFSVIEDQLPEAVRQRLDALTTLLWLWDIDGVPAAMAVGRLNPPTSRIGPVYTAPAFRGRGCAGALVGRLARALLRGGAEQVSLFTDLANPVSNSVYRRLGFRQVGELLHVDMVARGASAP